MLTGTRALPASTTEDCELPEAAIFDLDGTLLDSVDLHAIAWQEALLKFGHDVSFEQARSQIGKGGDKLIPVFLSADEQRDHGKELEEWRGHRFKTEYPAACASLLGGAGPAATRARRWTSDRRRFLGQEG
jgi:phosphoglycolate phosphatase-like HAD superfamily hydrolase